jgi:predicted acyltransferase
MNSRIESVDILRGFTIVLMILVNTPETWSTILRKVYSDNYKKKSSIRTFSNIKNLNILSQD